MTTWRVLLLFLAAGLAACGGGSTTGPTGGELLSDAHISNQIIVTLEEEDETEEELDELRADFDGISIEPLGSTLYILTVPAGTDLEELIKELDDDLRVIDAQPNYLGESPEGGPGNVKVLGGDLLASVADQPAYAGLDLAAAHTVSTGAGIVVAVIDTGVDADHPLLVGRVLPGGFDFIGQDPDPTDERNFIDDDADGLVDEQYGHGTFIASQILAVAPDASILPFRVLDAEGYGTTSALAAGIILAVDGGAQVISLSATLPREARAIKEAIRYARDRDVLVVASAGNGGRLEAAFPASISDVVGVTAVDLANEIPPFANRREDIALVAPAVDLVGAVPMDLGPDGTARWSGTSFAAPLVAGTAALVRAAFPALPADVVRARLEATAMNLGNPDAGFGVVRPVAALVP